MGLLVRVSFVCTWCAGGWGPGARGPVPHVRGGVCTWCAGGGRWIGTSWAHPGVLLDDDEVSPLSERIDPASHQRRGDILQSRAAPSAAP